MSKPTQTEEERDAEAETQRLAAIGELVAGVSHEARNMLSGILSFSQVGKARINDPEKISEILASIERETLRCIDLYAAVLSHASRGDANASSSSPQRANLGEALSSSVRLTEHQMGMKHVVLECPAPPPALALSIAASALRQVVLNLLLNAMQATPEGGRIVVSVVSSPHQVEIEFADSGPGVPLENREAIFERRYTTKSTGTGLGLAICRELLEHALGTICVQESALGGASFIITIPRSAESTYG